MVEVSTSVLNLGDKKLQEVILNLEIGKTDYIHIDVMDGKFVENDNYEEMLETTIRAKGISSFPLDVHLMCEDVAGAINGFGVLNPNSITFHIEACKSDEDVKKYIEMIKECNCKIGVAIKPNTSVETVYELLPYIHTVLVMTVEPGKGGQTYLADMTKKIASLKEYIDKNNYEVDIAVDGGINLVTAPKVKEAGANILVAGSSILMARNYGIIIRELKE